MPTSPNFMDKNGVENALALDTHLQLPAIEGFTSPTGLYDAIGRIAKISNEETGDTTQFELHGDDPDVTDNYESGNEITGQEYVFDADTITLDKPIIASRSVGDTQLDISHFPVMAPLARRCGLRTREKMERRLNIMAILAARTTSLTKDGITIHQGGHVIERTGGDIGTVYPRTATGAKTLRDDLFNMARLYDQRGIPRDSRLCVIDSYLEEVMYQDTTIFNRDLTNVPGDLVGRVITQIGGWMIMVNNWLPSTLITANSALRESNSKYQGDFRYNGATGRPVAAFLYSGADNEKAIGMRVKSGFRLVMDYSKRKTDTLIYGYMRNGMDPFSVECAGELRVKS